LSCGLTVTISWVWLEASITTISVPGKQKKTSYFCDLFTGLYVPSWPWSYMVVGFTTTYAISSNHHWCGQFESRSGRGVPHYVIKFVNDLWQVGCILRVFRFPPPIKLTGRI
jgi:hypothetical protein